MVLMNRGVKSNFILQAIANQQMTEAMPLKLTSKAATDNTYTDTHDNQV